MNQCLPHSLLALFSCLLATNHTEKWNKHFRPLICTLHTVCIQYIITHIMSLFLSTLVKGPGLKLWKIMWHICYTIYFSLSLPWVYMYYMSWQISMPNVFLYVAFVLTVLKFSSFFSLAPYRTRFWNIPFSCAELNPHALRMLIANFCSVLEKSKFTWGQTDKQWSLYFTPVFCSGELKLDVCHPRDDGQIPLYDMVHIPRPCIYWND